MPTIEQLARLWEAEMEFPETKPGYIPTQIPNRKQFSGEEIGVLKLDELTGDLKLVLNTDL